MSQVKFCQAERRAKTGLSDRQHDRKSYCLIQDIFESKKYDVNNYAGIAAINPNDPRQIAMNSHPI